MQLRSFLYCGDQSTSAMPPVSPVPITILRRRAGVVRIRPSYVRTQDGSTVRNTYASTQVEAARAAVRKLKLPKIMRERAMEEISLRLELQQPSLSLQTKPDLDTQKGQDEVLLRYLSFARRLCCRICSCFYLPKPRNCKSIFPFGASKLSGAERTTTERLAGGNLRSSLGC